MFKNDKIMKKVTFAVLGILVLLNFNFASAQRRGGNPDKKIEKRVQKMKEDLNLSDDQVNKITAIFKEARQKQVELRNSGADSASMRKSMREINKETRSQVKLVLSEEQRKKWVDLMKQRREEKKESTEPKE
jgi:periplasmic protein CpxP/Spy